MARARPGQSDRAPMTSLSARIDSYRARIEQVLDMLLENQLVPFIELTGLTRMLIPEGSTDGWRVGPPQDWGKWEELVRALKA